MHKYILFTLSIFLFSCSPKLMPVSNQEKEIVNFMTGSFDSSMQAAQDSSYYDITLHMYEIWKDKPGSWIYVEQAVSSMQDKPYRQRVYQLIPGEGGAFQSVVYTINNQDEVIGAWKQDGAFDKYTFNDLLIRKGCTVYMKKTKKGYTGSTMNDNCKSDFRGASYATSIVNITGTIIESWDQGFDATGKQVWGAEKGSYVFNRKKK